METIFEKYTRLKSKIKTGDIILLREFSIFDSFLDSSSLTHTHSAIASWIVINNKDKLCLLRVLNSRVELEFFDGVINELENFTLISIKRSNEEINEVMNNLTDIEYLKKRNLRITNLLQLYTKMLGFTEYSLKKTIHPEDYIRYIDSLHTVILK